MLTYKLFLLCAISFFVLKDGHCRPMSETNEIINTLKDIDAALLNDDDDDADLDNDAASESDNAASKNNSTDVASKNSTKEEAALTNTNSTKLNETQAIASADKLSDESQSKANEEDKTKDNVKSESAKDESVTKDESASISESNKNQTKAEEKATARSNGPRDGGIMGANPPEGNPTEAKEDEEKEDEEKEPISPAELLTSEQNDPAPEGAIADSGPAKEGEPKQFSKHKQTSGQPSLVPHPQVASLQPQGNITNLASTEEGSGDAVESQGSGEEQADMEDASLTEGSAVGETDSAEEGGDTQENNAEENEGEDDDKVKMFFISPFDKSSSNANDASARQILTYPASGHGTIQNHHGGPSHIWNSDYPYFAYGYSWGCGHHAYTPNQSLKKSDTKPKKDDLICRDYILLPALSHSSIMTVSPDDSQENGVARQIVNKDIACNDNDAVCTQKQVIGSMAGGSLFGDGMGGLGMGFPGIAGMHTGVSGYNMAGGFGDRLPTGQAGVTDAGCCTGPAGYATQGRQTDCACGGLGDGLGPGLAAGYPAGAGLGRRIRGGRHGGFGWGIGPEGVAGARFFHANDHGVPSFWGAKDNIPIKKPKNEKPTKKTTVKKTKVKKRQFMRMNNPGFGFAFGLNNGFPGFPKLNDWFPNTPNGGMGPQFADSSINGGVPVNLKFNGLRESPLGAAGWGSDRVVQNIPSGAASWGGVTESNCIDNEQGPLGCGPNNNRFVGSRMSANNLAPTDKTIVMPEEINGFQPGRPDAQFVSNPVAPVMPSDGLNNAFTGDTAVGFNSLAQSALNNDQAVTAFGGNNFAGGDNSMANFVGGGQAIGTAYVQGMQGVGTAEGFGPRAAGVPGSEMAAEAAGLPEGTAENFPAGLPRPNFAYKSKIKKKKAVKDKAAVKGTTRQDIAMPDEQALMDVTKQRQLIGSLGASTLFADNVGGLGLGHPGVPGMSSGISGIPGEYGGTGGYSQGWDSERPGLNRNGFNAFGYNYGRSGDQSRSHSAQSRPEHAQDEQGQKREVITNANEDESESEANNRQIISPLPSDNSAPAQTYEQLPSEEHGYVPLVKLSHSAVSSTNRFINFPRKSMLNSRADDDDPEDENAGGGALFSHYGSLNGFYHAPDRNERPRHVHVGVGTPSVKVEVETSKSEIARNPAVHVSVNKMSEIRKLVHEVSDSLAKTNQKLKALKKHHTPSKPKEKGDKRQITPAFTPVVAEPAAVPDIRYPVPSADRYPLGAGYIWPSANYGHQYGGPYAWSKSHTPQGGKGGKKDKKANKKSQKAKTRRSVVEKDHKDKTGNKRQLLPRPNYSKRFGGLDYGGGSPFGFGRPLRNSFFGGRPLGRARYGHDYSFSPIRGYSPYGSSYRTTHHMFGRGGYPGIGLSHNTDGLGGFGPGGTQLSNSFFDGGNHGFDAGMGRILSGGADSSIGAPLSHMGFSQTAVDPVGYNTKPHPFGGILGSNAGPYPAGVPFDGNRYVDRPSRVLTGGFSSFSPFGHNGLDCGGSTCGSTFPATTGTMGFGTGPGILGNAAGIGGPLTGIPTGAGARHVGSAQAGIDDSTMSASPMGGMGLAGAMPSSSPNGMDALNGMSGHISGFESDASIPAYGRQNIADQQGEQDASQSSQFMPMSRSQMPDQMPSMIPDNQQAMFSSQAMSSYGSDIRASEFPASKKSDVPKHEETPAKKE